MKTQTSRRFLTKLAARRALRASRLLPLVALLFVSRTALANTEDDVVNGQSDLTLAATYSGGTPTTTSDVTFTAVAYSPAAFTLNGSAALSIGTLNDLSTTALTISNATASTTSTLTLNGGTNSVAPNAADGIYVASGANLSIGANSSTAGVVNVVLNSTVNFDVVGTLNLNGYTGTSFTSNTSAITGSGGIVKNGAGTLNITATDNTFSGGITINAGTVSINTTSGSLGTGTVTLNGGTLNLGNISNSGSALSNAVAVSSASTFSSSVKSNSFSGALSGAGNLALSLTNTDTFTPSGSWSAYTGTVTVTPTASGSANLRLGAAYVGPATGTVSLTSGITMSEQTATNGTASFTFGSLNAVAGSFITAAGATASGTLTYNLGGANLDNTIAAVVSNGSGGMKTAITKTGTGALVLSGANTYTGATTVSGGALVINSDAAVGAVATGTAVTLNGGALVSNATFALDNGSATTNARGVVLTATTGGTLAATTGNTFTVDGVVSGTGPLAVGTGTIGTTGVNGSGNGTVVLTAGNTYSGLTTISAGTLNINGQFALGGANYSGLTINGGTLQYAASLSGANGTGDVSANSGGTAKPVTIGANGATIDTNGNSITFANSIGNNGAGALTVKSTATGGVLTLAAAATYTGATTVTGSTLVLSTGSINTSGTVNVNNVGALTLQNATALSDTGTLSLVSGTTLNLNAASGTSETIGSLILDGTAEPAGTYTAAQLTALDSSITFGSANGETLIVASMTAVPEPSTYLGGVLLLVSVAGWSLRRHRATKMISAI